MGETMIDQTRIWTQAPWISCQLLYQLSYLALAMELVWLSHSLLLNDLNCLRWKIWEEIQNHTLSLLFCLLNGSCSFNLKIYFCITGSRGIVGTITENLLLWKTTDHWQAFSPPYKLDSRFSECCSAKETGKSGSLFCCIECQAFLHVAVFNDDGNDLR